MPLRLIIEDDEGATTIVPLGKEAITIGRQQGNTIQLTEKNVSRTHARLFQDSEIWMIEDLNSYNGIKVNDKSVDGRMKLREGDIVQIGDYHLAITEDVDKRTLNYDRPGQVANDGDPLLASSSSDLPRLSPEEIHALSSGPQQITPPPSPMLMDSGPVPATAYVPGYSEPQKKGSGVLVMVGLLVVGAAALGIFFVVDGSKNNAAATADKGDGGEAKPAKAVTPPPKPVRPPADDGTPPQPPPVSADDGAVEPVPVDPTAAEVEPPVPDPDPVVEDPVADVPDPVPTAAIKKKKQPTPSPVPKPPTPTPPKDTGPSAEELLAEARASRSDPGEMWRLANLSYKKKASGAALTLMGTAACNMGDKTKAKQAYGKLRGSAKEGIKTLCGMKGVEL